MVAYCGWDPTAVVTDGTVVLDGNGTALAFLPSLHVTGVSALTVTLDDGSTYDALIGAGLDVMWGENGTLQWLPSSLALSAFPDALANVSVTYSGGYAEIPADLAAALASVSARIPTMQTGMSTAKIGTAVITRAASIAQGALLLVEQMVFDRYRILKAA